jgi:hypothetical protein
MLAMQVAPRVLLGRFLVGSGLEIGPGESPFPLAFGGAVAVSCDQWSADQNRTLFPEVDGTRFGDADLQFDLNVDRLSRFGDGTQDFVIASHCWSTWSSRSGNWLTSTAC